jgi:uncharacterized protein (TIGR02246 family)
VTAIVWHGASPEVVLMTRNNRFFFFVVAVVALLSACAQPQPAAPPDTRAADEAAIRAAAADWASTFPAKDVDKFVSFYAPDATVYPQGAPAVTGGAAIRGFWSDFFSLPGFAGSVALKSVEVARSGDLAYETGTYEMTLNDAKGKPTKSTGKYLVVWKKQSDGKWKAHADFFNADK